MGTDPGEEDIKNKMDSFNEHMLKATAITFSMEGVSRDLNTYIQKKITFNNRSLKYLTELIRCLSESENIEFVSQILGTGTKNKDTIFKLMNHLMEEVKTTNSIINFVIQKIIEKESSLSKDLMSGSKSKTKSSNKQS